VPETPIARVARYVDTAGRHGLDDVADSILDATGTGRLDLRLSDLAAVLELHHELCPDVERCAACNAVACPAHGLGELTECDPPHCLTSPWCWCSACLDAHREDLAADAHREDAV